MFSLRNLQDSKAILAEVPPVSRAWPPNYGKEHSTGKKKPCPVHCCLLGHQLGKNWFLCMQLPWQAPASFQPILFKATNPTPMEMFSAFRGDSGCAPKLSEFSTYSDYYRFSSQERVCHTVERAWAPESDRPQFKSRFHLVTVWPCHLCFFICRMRTKST